MSNEKMKSRREQFHWQCERCAARELCEGLNRENQKPSDAEIEKRKCDHYQPNIDENGRLHVHWDLIRENQSGDMVDLLDHADNEMKYALRYLGYARERAEVGETKNARFLAEVAERSFLRAFLYLQNAIKGPDSEENNS